jgi:FkbM family methyltransferase
MSKLQGLMWAVSHAAERRFRMPARTRAWAQQREPFVHTARHGLLFELVPGEYVDRHIYVEGIFERRFLDGLYAYFTRHRGDVMLDVGCNIGNHSCFLADRFRAVHAFDPNPIVTARMQANVARNRIGNVTIRTVGLGDAPSTLHLKVNRDGNLGASFLTDKPDALTQAVPIVVGDHIVGEQVQGKVDFLKVDVEGHELAVFTGLRQTIARHRPIIAFEFHAAERPPGEWDAISAVLGGYVFTEPMQAPAEASKVDKLRWHLERCGRPVLARFTQPEQRSYDNILAFPDSATLARFDAVHPRP